MITTTPFTRIKFLASLASRPHVLLKVRRSPVSRFSQSHIMADEQPINKHEGATLSGSENSKDQKSGLPLGLPEPGTGTKILDVGSGQSVVLDHLGPMVVNTDGTLSRINNWNQMTDMERQSTLRIVGKRNKSRLEKLKNKEGQEGAE